LAAADPHDVGSAAKDKDVRERPRMAHDVPPQPAWSELPDTESLKPVAAFERPPFFRRVEVFSRVLRGFDTSTSCPSFFVA